MHKNLTVSIIFSTAVLLVVFFFIARQIRPKVEFNSRQWTVMGTLAGYSSRSSAEDADKEAKIVSAVFAEIERDFSAHTTNGLVRAVSATAGANSEASVTLRKDISSENNMLQVLLFAKKIAEESGGAFDPTVNPLMRVWGFRKAKRDTRPTGEEIRAALDLCGWEKLQITDLGDTATVRLDSGEGAGLDFGGIAKGFAIDLAFDRLVAAGATNFCINLGGNIRVCGTPSESREAWTIAIRDPHDGDGKAGPVMKQSGRTLELFSGEAVATSGSYERFVEIDGVRYSHIVDPRSGYPVPTCGSASVVAHSAIEADALSTATFVMGEEEGLKFIKSRPGCRAVFVR